MAVKLTHRWIGRLACLEVIVILPQLKTVHTYLPWYVFFFQVIVVRSSTTRDGKHYQKQLDQQKYGRMYRLKQLLLTVPILLSSLQLARICQDWKQ